MKERVWIILSGPSSDAKIYGKAGYSERVTKVRQVLEGWYWPACALQAVLGSVVLMQYAQTGRPIYGGAFFHDDLK